MESQKTTQDTSTQSTSTDNTNPPSKNVSLGVSVGEQQGELPDL